MCVLPCVLQESASRKAASSEREKICERLSAGEEQLSSLFVRQHYFCGNVSSHGGDSGYEYSWAPTHSFFHFKYTNTRTAFIRLDTHQLYNQIKATSALKLLSKIRISKQEQIVKHNQLITKPHLFTRKFRSLFKTLNQREEKTVCYCHPLVFERKIGQFQLFLGEIW